MKVKQLGLIVCVLVFLLIISSGCQNHKHIYGEWGVTLAATCTAEGIETRTCECGETETRSIKETGHSFGNWVTTTAATCTAEGIKTRTCSCGEKETKAIKAIHNFGEWKVTTAATCTAEGIETRTCSCGEKETKNISKINHSYDTGTITKNPSLSSTGEKQYTCLLCGITKEETLPKIDLNTSGYKQGTYKCPDDIPEGEYILISEIHQGYFSITADPMGNNIIDNDNFGPVSHIRIVSGVYLELSRCIAVPYSDEISFAIVNNGFITGTYKVGKDIPAGTYKLTALSGGYYSIHDKPHGDILSNDFFDEGTCYIILKNGQYVTFDAVKIEES